VLPNAESVAARETKFLRDLADDLGDEAFEDAVRNLLIRVGGLFVYEAATHALKLWRAEMGENPKHNFFDIQLLMFPNRMRVLDIWTRIRLS
jgi:hypothetical protein